MNRASKTRLAAQARTDADPSTTPGVRVRGGRQGLTLPRHIAGTAHLGAIYPFGLEAGLGDHGVLLGRNHLTGGEGFFFDLFAAYEAGLIQGPNAVISGAGAHGKSAIAKALIYRSSILRTAGRARFTAVIDPKGEWIPLAHALGWTALQLRPGGGIRINPLDAGPGHRAPDAPQAARQPADQDRPHVDDVTARRAGIASTLLAVSLGEPELTASQRRLLTAALRRLGAALQTTDPTLVDLQRLLANPPAELADELDTTFDELLERRRLLLGACAILVDQDLRGMCDGPTNVDLDWDTTTGLVLDLSALLPHRTALRLVLTATAGWLATLMYGRPDHHKLNIIDEGWAALDDLAIVRYLQDQWRLGRQWGCGNILITHAIADLQSQTDDCAAQNKIAAGLLNTTSVRIFLHQNPEQAGQLLQEMGLSYPEAGLLSRLAPFQALWKIGPSTALVGHEIAPHEWPLLDTDTAMRG